MGMNSLGEPEVAAAKRRAVTLQVVADEADVAVSTASRALSNPDRVSAATVAEFWNSTGLFSTATADSLRRCPDPATPQAVTLWSAAQGAFSLT